MGLPAPWLFVLVIGCIALAAIPTRRLFDAGIRPAWLTAYLVVVVALGVAVVLARGPARFLVPFLVVLYVAPLVVAPETTARWLRRGRRAPKHVGSGPGRDVGPDGSADPGWPPPGDRAGAPKQVGSGPGRDVGQEEQPEERASGAGGDRSGPGPDAPA
jgi:hypothetical protein